MSSKPLLRASSLVEDRQDPIAAEKLRHQQGGCTNIPTIRSVDPDWFSLNYSGATTGNRGCSIPVAAGREVASKLAVPLIPEALLPRSAPLTNNAVHTLFKDAFRLLLKLGDRAALQQAFLARSTLDHSLLIPKTHSDLAGSTTRLICLCTALAYHKDVRTSAMPKSGKASVDEVVYKKLLYRTVSPLEHQLEPLDVLVKVERTRLQRLAAKVSGSLRPLVRQGSMLDKDLMGDAAEWRSVKSNIVGGLWDGLSELRNSIIENPSDKEVFKKMVMPKVDLKCSTSKGVSAWLMGIAGIDLEKEEKLSCTLDGLTSASVEYSKIRKWLTDGDWCPNATTLALCSADWSKENGNKVKSLWIVTEVLYATKFLVKGRSGLFGGVSAQVPSGLPGLNAGGDLTVEYEKDNVVKLEAKRDSQFKIGYRTMRVDYNPDGSVRAVRAPGDTGLRGDNYDDPCKRNLKLMEEDIFEVDEEGDKVPIPLLTPTKEELDYLKQTDANYRDFQGSVSS